MTEQVLDLFEKSAKAKDDGSKFRLTLLSLAGILGVYVFLLVHACH